MEMVYVRRYPKKRFRRSGRLSKSNILANRSAKAQSRQIAALNRKVNILTKVNRPEILTRWVVLERTFTNASLASNYEIYSWGPSNTNYSGNQDYTDTIQGNFNRVKGINVRFNVEYSDSWSGNVSQSENHQRTASYRIVILQLTKQLNDEPTTSQYFDSIFQPSSTLSSNDSNVLRPLKSGLTSKYKVLYSKAFGISNEHPIRLHNLRFNKCVNYYYETSSTGNRINPNAAKGTLIVAILTGGLHADADYNSQINVNTMIKIAFTDN